MSDRKTIENLIAQIALGNKPALDQLYSYTSAKLFGVCLRVLGDRAAAEDALQDSFVKIWRNAARYQVNGLSPMTWLITIARNTSIDMKRKVAPATGEDLDMSLRDPSPGPEDLVIAKDSTNQLNMCLAELKEGHAEAVKRVYLEGASYADLAESFGVPLNTMRTWLRRSLLSLRECLSNG